MATVEKTISSRRIKSVASDAAEKMAEDLLQPRYQSRLKDKAYLASLRKELDSVGFVCLEGFLQKDALTRLQREVSELEGQAQANHSGKNQKYSVKGAMLNGTVVDELAKSKPILDLINGILQDGSDGRRPIIEDSIVGTEVVPGLNIMRGPGDVTTLHFDGTFMNILVPVFIPKIEGPNRGQLTIYPNVRSFRRNFYDRIVVPILCRAKLARFLFRPAEIDYEPGNIYIFYGYRSFHGVLSPSAPGLRCTTNMTVGARRF